MPMESTVAPENLRAAGTDPLTWVRMDRKLCSLVLGGERVTAKRQLCDAEVGVCEAAWAAGVVGSG